MASFRIGTRKLPLGAHRAGPPGASAPAAPGVGYTIASSPYPYEVAFAAEASPGATVAGLVAGEARPLLVADRLVAEAHLDLESLAGRGPCLVREATEELKGLEGVVGILDFLVEHGAGRGAMVVVVGGGILQDAAGFACAVLKRGVPWTYVPTTLLAQADSCIGAKTSVNYRHTKNLLGAFSAPRRVVLHAGFLATLAAADVRSGLGEILKLCITGGEECLSAFEARRERALAGDVATLGELASLALAVKRPVIEADERDENERRALNFGHSIGHGLEVLTDHALPHGTAVCVGALVESVVSRDRNLLGEAALARIATSARALLPPGTRERLAGIDLDALLELLGRDKKVEGRVLKLALPVAIGATDFVDLPLDARGAADLARAVAESCALL